MIISQHMLCNIMFVNLSLINPFFNSFGCDQSINCDISNLFWTMDSCCSLLIYLYVYQFELNVYIGVPVLPDYTNGELQYKIHSLRRRPFKFYEILEFFHNLERLLRKLNVL